MAISCSRRSALVIRTRPERRCFGSVIRPSHHDLVVTRRASSRSVTGHRTSVTQPAFSIQRIVRAEVSTWPFRTPWRAQVGSEWCRLCQDSPWLRIASHQTLPDLSRLLNGRAPIVWQIELIDQVTWCSSAIRTSEAQKNAVSAPVIDQDHNPPMTAGASSETTTRYRNSRDTLTTSLSLSRSGAY